MAVPQASQAVADERVKVALQSEQVLSVWEQVAQFEMAVSQAAQEDEEARVNGAVQAEHTALADESTNVQVAQLATPCLVASLHFLQLDLSVTTMNVLSVQVSHFVESVASQVSQPFAGSALHSSAAKTLLRARANTRMSLRDKDIFFSLKDLFFF